MTRARKTARRAIERNSQRSQRRTNNLFERLELGARVVDDDGVEAAVERGHLVGEEAAAAVARVGAATR